MPKSAKELRAMERGEQIRGELLARLEKKGPQTPADLLKQLDRKLDVSLPEVVFQLGRLEDEDGSVVREAGGAYRLT